jgi:6-phosphogluconolactonase
MSETVVVVVPDADILASAVAARLVVKIIDAQAERGWAGVVLTGGRIAAKVLRSVKELPAVDAIDWSRVDLWWGDERFLPAGHPDRNDTQAREALLDALPLDPARVHPMPASDGAFGDDVDAAARGYAEQLLAATGPSDRGEVPDFDILLLGVGPDAHVASLFPEHPALYETDRTVVGVRGSPKPPPVRISLSMPAICAAQSVWLLAAGADKAAAVALGLSAAGEVAVPAAGARGRRSTVWLLDRAAAARIPRGLARPASP